MGFLSRGFLSHMAGVNGKSMAQDETLKEGKYTDGGAWYNIDKLVLSIACKFGLVHERSKNHADNTEKHSSATHFRPKDS